jgi:hypothetical protein
MADELGSGERFGDALTRAIGEAAAPAGGRVFPNAATTEIKALAWTMAVDDPDWAKVG